MTRVNTLRRHRARWRVLGSADRMIYLRALTLLITLRIALWTLPFPRVLRLVHRLANEESVGPENIDRLRLTAARAVGTMSRYVPSASCLTQSLTLFVLLKKWRDPVSLKIGVAKSDAGKLMAHAWIETPDGVCLSMQGQGIFQPLIQYDNHDAS